MPLEMDDTMDCCSKTESEGVSSPRSESPSSAPTGSHIRPILLDIQMLETTHGYRIKELAYKTLPVYVPMDGPEPVPSSDKGVHYMCFRHDGNDVPSHRTVEVGGRLRDRYTGLEIDGGGEAYSDERVVYELRFYNVIFLKGHNKKKLLLDLFKRCAHVLPETPTVVNVDAFTLDDDDAKFCEEHRMTTARFSFRFVYRRFATYLSLLFDHNGRWPSDHPVFLNNAVVADSRFDVYSRGRSLWICPHDHSCGRRWFTSQRCAALNVGLLETLWYMMREQDFCRMLKANNTDPSSNNADDDGAKSRPDGERSTPQRPGPVARNKRRRRAKKYTSSRDSDAPEFPNRRIASSRDHYPR